MQRRQQWRQQLVALQRPVHLRSYLCESYPHDDRLASVRRGSSEYLLLLLQDCNKAAFAKAPAAFFTCLGSQAMSEPAQSRNTTHLTSGLWHRIKVWFLVRCMRSCDSQAGRQAAASMETDSRFNTGEWSDSQQRELVCSSDTVERLHSLLSYRYVFPFS